ncbi:hypothetical protein SRA_02846 [Streptococcus ratti FA-1 = DSM 20564]|uniref:Uncharacterized protein n=1 Tax=Streptococcus ratti FA-1 = DSM 20564 TaxID=699248 RepID=A0ABP2QWM2_STRRT|nr:hypothetical protein SRA_02846 [Streptococcus ratti FA-1 = DSM 20564]
MDIIAFEDSDQEAAVDFSILEVDNRFCRYQLYPQ